jgi:hypothetical protein
MRANGITTAKIVAHYLNHYLDIVAYSVRMEPSHVHQFRPGRIVAASTAFNICFGSILLKKAVVAAGVDR